MIKGGIIAWSKMGEANASIPTPQAVHTGPMFGSSTSARHATSFTFISQAGLEKEIPQMLGLQKSAVAVSGTRQITKIEVDPETYEVQVDGELFTCEPATVLPMAQRYFLF